MSISFALRPQTSPFARRHLIVVSGILLIFSWVVFGFAPFAAPVASSQSTTVEGRALSLEQRVAYQRAVEEVYWRHTVWPKQNAGPKPSLDAVAPREATESNVVDMLRKSDALARLWKRPITAGQLQAEAKRMARETRQPEVLRELYEALDNDPFVIAEVLARPVLVERLARNTYAFDERFHGALRKRAEADVQTHTTPAGMRQMSGNFSEVQAVKVASPAPRTVGTEDMARAATTSDAGAPLQLTAAEWKIETARLQQMFDASSCPTCDGDASAMSQGNVSAGEESDGATEDAANVASVNLPTNRVSGLQEDANGFYVAAVVEKTATRLKVARVEWPKTSFESWWSNARNEYSADTSAAEGDSVYHLARISQAASSGADDTWTPTKALPIANGTAIWTGTEMIVWGGEPITGGRTNSGSRYNPAIDTWTPTSTTNAPSPRRGHSAVWTGTEMLVWGGCGQSQSFCSLNTGGRYNPTTDTWTTTSTAGITGSTGQSAIWTGSKMIVWGGCSLGSNNSCSSSTRLKNTGGVYNPTTDTWTPTSTTGAPSPRSGHKAVWTGSEMIVWGGSSSNTGGRYNLATDTWTPTSTFNAPSVRTGATAVWTGSEMVYWGGYEGNTVTLNTGGRYNPTTDIWTPTTTTNAPAPRFGHTAVWTGTEMIVFGGDPRSSNANATDTGGRYNPSTDSWTPTSTVNAPVKGGHLSVWTGSEMIVWSSAYPKTGGRYNPSTDSWLPTDNNDSVGIVDAGVWTGTEVLVWGPMPGCSGCGTHGGRYNPTTYSWSPMNVANAPTAFSGSTAVWTGTEMLVWGTDGGRYNPQANAWTRMQATGAPVGGKAVWTGSELIVWGGQGSGRYNLSTDTWSPISTVDAPSERQYYSAIWANDEMIIWGGYSAGVYVNTGGRYNPATDTWTPTSTTNAPDVRIHHSTVWTGTEMVVWGGRTGDYTSSQGILNTGGRYNPATDTWTPTSLVGAPSARFTHSAVWTGSLMLVWGGQSQTAVYVTGVNTGARYNPLSDAWTPISTTAAPSARSNHIALWTDIGMFIWGGFTEDGTATHGAIYNAPAASANNPPSISITSPAEGASIESGAPINIETSVADTDGTIKVVHFYADNTLVGTDSIAPFSFTWTESRGGSHSLTATATDDGGGITASVPVRINVAISTAPPICVLTSPTDGETHTAPADVKVAADARANRDRTMSKVEFFDGTRAVGVYTNGPYGYTWTNIPEGQHYFWVRCTDSAGDVTTSPTSVVTINPATSAVTITGQVTLNGSGLQNIRVRLDSSQGTTPVYATTNLNGYYQFYPPSGANVTITPESANYSFTPPSMTFNALTQDQLNANFYATQIGYSISGNLRNASGQPIYPATINLSGSKTAVTGTDVNGYYFFSNLAPGGNYTVQPYKNQTNFEPSVRTYTNLAAHQTADFTGRPATYTVSGRVADGGGNALSGVTVAMSGTQSATATTGADGLYSFADLAPGGSYTFTPSKSGFNFNPGSRSYANLAGNQTSNFAGTIVTQSVTVQAEDFDDAWDGKAYHDTTPSNLGGQYRVSGVDITTCPNGRCSYMIGWNKTGEWLHYTVSIAEPGAYTLALRVANTAVGGSLRVEVDGVDATGAMPVPNTGDAYTWTTISKSGINLGAGQHSVKILMESESTQGWVGNLDSLTLSKEQTTATRVNHALAASGSTATGSSQYNASFPSAAAIDGDRFHLFMTDGRYNMWHSAPGTPKPDYLTINFAAPKSVDEINVITQQDDYANAVNPTEATTFTAYGLKDFEVQYWSGSAWLPVPGGTVTGNNKVWRKFTFAAVTTTKIRIRVNTTADGFSRIWEVEAWGSATLPPPPTGRVNVALDTNGGRAAASSQYNANFPVASVNNGDRFHLYAPDGRYNMWHSAYGAQKPDRLEIAFSAAKTIDEIVVVTQQDDYANAIDPTDQTAFTRYGLTNFEAQYWNGTAWVTVPGGSVTTNDRVLRRITFPAITTTKIRLVINATSDGYSRVWELEAWGQ